MIFGVPISLQLKELLKENLSIARGVNGLDIYSMATVDSCWICDKTPTVCQHFVNGFEINVKNITLF